MQTTNAPMEAIQATAAMLAREPGGVVIHYRRHERRALRAVVVRNPDHPTFWIVIWCDKRGILVTRNAGSKYEAVEKALRGFPSSHRTH